MQLGCNNSSIQCFRAARLAIGAVQLQTVTSGYYSVTAEASGSSPLVPAGSQGWQCVLYAEAARGVAKVWQNLCQGKAPSVLIRRLARR